MKSFKLMLAPMENHTNPKFRELCFNNGATSTFTEMARISALARKNKSTLNKIDIPKPIPTYIQLVGANEKELNKFLENFKPQNGFLGFNLNLGCSSPNITNRGMGSALIKRISKVQKLVDTIRKHNYPVSIKMRLGLNQFEKNKRAYINLIKKIDADFFVVHARHGKQDLSSPADFSIYEECVKTGKVIIANGDISSKNQIRELKRIGIKGVMIGRAAIKNPKIFSDLK